MHLDLKLQLAEESLEINFWVYKLVSENEYKPNKTAAAPAI